MGVRVFLVDDEELLTESMEIILTVKGQMEVVGIAKDGKEALEKLEQVTADIALVDLTPTAHTTRQRKLKSYFPRN